MKAAVPRKADAVPPLRSNRDFRLLWIGQAMSEFGSSMVFIALPMVLLSGGYSPSAIGMIGTAVLITALLARMPGGYLADRCNHRSLMLTADLVRFTVFGVVTVFTFAGRLPLELAVVAVVIAQLGAEVFKPSQQAVVRLVVPREQLPTAISLNHARAYGAEIIAPAAAGVLVAVSLGLPFAVDTLAFAISSVCVYLLSPLARASRASGPAGSPAGGEPAGGETRVKEGLLRELTAGLRYTLGQRFLRTIVVFAAALNFLFQALVYALIMTFAQGSGSGAVGVALSASAVAGLAGSLTAPFLQRRLPFRVIVGAGPGLCGLLLAVAWWNSSEIAFGASLAAMSLLTPVVGAAFGVLLATLVPREIYGRTTSSISVVSEILQPLGPLAAGLLLAALSMSGVAAVFAAGFTALAVLALFLPKPPPSVEP